MTLAEDLVTAAAEAICQTYDKSVTEASLPVIHATKPDEWTPEARAAVVAVLRRLAGYQGGALFSENFRSLANMIEDGGSRG